MVCLSGLSTQIRAFLNKSIKNKQGVIAIEYAVVAAGLAAIIAIIFSTNGPVSSTLYYIFTQVSAKIATVI
ncbi:hypothetical protein A9G41_10525 [Gilliamella sp. Nev5-1]|uniref:Flp family type IVb pilin n=1 Tax=unclassified Gilliamella TaxID=2685620 RepID=UPI00080E24FF|nr:Flp family type IVb pilin [Gilliamella apicola]OCG57650.1 hypothetical protein A9G40_12005 [Gilliamella apicola]OCG67314.1 hypothetical protein A9G41_10525 [Gilliamella apicola]